MELGHFFLMGDELPLATLHYLQYWHQATGIQTGRLTDERRHANTGWGGGGGGGETEI